MSVLLQYGMGTAWLYLKFRNGPAVCIPAQEVEPLHVTVSIHGLLKDMNLDHFQ